jgi:hypothetical protein
MSPSGRRIERASSPEVSGGIGHYYTDVGQRAHQRLRAWAIAEVEVAQAEEERTHGK